MFQYWRDATDIGAARARPAVARDPRLQVLGDYSLRYTARVYTITCTQWEECDTNGTGWTRRHSLKMAPTRTEEGKAGPVTAHVEHADRNTVTREVVRVVTGLVRGLKEANRTAEEGARRFADRCS
jgi:hypothetical protein